MMDNMKSDTPVVSIVMPAYQAEPFVEEAIRSVMAQTVTDWELLVLDDGSSDATPEIIKRLAREDSRIHYLPNATNLGVAKTRNRGFDLCRGAYIALLDSDDVWHPDKLEKQLALAQRTEADLICCSYAIVDIRGNPVKPDYVVPERINFSGLLKENAIGCSTVLLSANAMQRYRFSADFYHEDYVLWLQMLRDGCKAVCCREVLVDWRYLPNSRSFNKRKSAVNRWAIYRRYLHLPFFESLYCFVSYAFRGVKKYFKTQ